MRDTSGLGGCAEASSVGTTGKSLTQSHSEGSIGSVFEKPKSKARSCLNNCVYVAFFLFFFFLFRLSNWQLLEENELCILYQANWYGDLKTATS